MKCLAAPNVSRILYKELADHRILNHNETRILVGILTPLRVEFFGQLTSANESTFIMV